MMGVTLAGVARIRGGHLSGGGSRGQVYHVAGGSRSWGVSMLCIPVLYIIHIAVYVYMYYIEVLHQSIIYLIFLLHIYKL